MTLWDADGQFDGGVGITVLSPTTFSIPQNGTGGAAGGATGQVIRIKAWEVTGSAGLGAIVGAGGSFDKCLLMRNLTVPRVGYNAWLAKQLSGDHVRIGQPMKWDLVTALANFDYNSAGIIGTFNVGDAYDVCTMPSIDVVDWTLETSEYPKTIANAFVCENLRFSGSADFSNVGNFVGSGSVHAHNCYFQILQQQTITIYGTNCQYEYMSPIDGAYLGVNGGLLTGSGIQGGGSGTQVEMSKGPLIQNSSVYIAEGGLFYQHCNGVDPLGIFDSNNVITIADQYSSMQCGGHWMVGSGNSGTILNILGTANVSSDGVIFLLSRGGAGHDFLLNGRAVGQQVDLVTDRVSPVQRATTFKSLRQSRSSIFPPYTIRSDASLCGIRPLA